MNHNFLIRRNRHHNHKQGDILYYNCQYMNGPRKAIVLQAIDHHGLVYYVLEVETGPPLNDSFLYIASEFRVFSEDEI